YKVTLRILDIADHLPAFKWCINRIVARDSVQHVPGTCFVAWILCSRTILIHAAVEIAFSACAADDWNCVIEYLADRAAISIALSLVSRTFLPHIGRAFYRPFRFLRALPEAQIVRGEFERPRSRIVFATILRRVLAFERDLFQQISHGAGMLGHSPNM